jgi:hypothetical protein
MDSRRLHDQRVFRAVEKVFGNVARGNFRMLARQADDGLHGASLPRWRLPAGRSVGWRGRVVQQGLQQNAPG